MFGVSEDDRRVKSFPHAAFPFPPLKSAPLSLLPHSARRIATAAAEASPPVACSRFEAAAAETIFTDRHFLGQGNQVAKDFNYANLPVLVSE